MAADDERKAKVADDKRKAKIMKKGTLNRDKFLQQFIPMYLDGKSGLQGSLVCCLLRHFVNTVNGRKNCEYEPIVRNFMLALSATNKQAREIVCGNLKLSGDRSVRRMAAKERGNPVVPNKAEDVKKLIVNRIEMIRDGFGDRSKRISFTVGLDATAIVKGYVYLHQADVIVGGAFPQHHIDVSHMSNAETRARLSALIAEQETGGLLAAEVKLVVVSFQNTPKNLPPYLVVAGLPQTINDANDWGAGVVAAW